MKLRGLWLSAVITGIFVTILPAGAGAQSQVIAGSLTQPTSIVVDGTKVYWTEGPFFTGITASGNYCVQWCNKAGSAPVYAYWDNPGLAFQGLAQDAINLYFCLYAPGVTHTVTASPWEGPAPLSVNFLGPTALGNVTAWFWDFNDTDGATGNTQNPSHTYDLPGIYDPHCVASGPGGSTEGWDVFVTVYGVGNGGPAWIPNVYLPNMEIVSLPKIATSQTSLQPLFKFYMDSEQQSWGGLGPLAVHLGKVFFAVNDFMADLTLDIRSCPSQGATDASQVPLLANYGLITCMATDNLYVYWGEQNQDLTGAISWVPQVGGIRSTISLSSPPFSMVTPTSGAGGGKCFWLEADPTYGPSLEVCSLGEQNPKVLASPVYSSPNGWIGGSIAVDTVNVYYFGFGASGIELLQQPIAGGPATVLASGLTNPQALAVDNNYVYWTDWGDTTGSTAKGTVNRAPKTSGKVGVPQVSSWLPLLLSK